jgi:outer membrane biosynthesis protein TonB
MFIASLTQDALGKEASSAKPTVYNYVTKNSNPVEEQAVKKVFRTKFNIVDIGDEKSYVRSRCTKRVVPKPQRDASNHLLIGYVRVVFIATSRGYVIEPFILRSNNHSLDAIVLAKIKEWRGAPARLNGVAVSTLVSQDFDFRRL